MTEEMPIRAAPFAHQRAACEQALTAFGLRSPPAANGDNTPPRIRADDDATGEERPAANDGGETKNGGAVDGSTASDQPAPVQLLSRGFALLMEMGCGKSLTAIAITGSLRVDNLISKVLIVAPLSITGVWEEEFRKFAAFDYSLAVLEGSGTKKADTLRHMKGATLQVVVTNYESAWRLENELLAWLKSGDGNAGSAASGGGSLVITDESHKIKTFNTKASKSLHKIGAAADYRLLLTGTVITNRPLDIFSQYKFLNPAVFGTSYYSWRSRYFDAYGFQNKQFRLKKSMEGELTAKLHSIAFRATKAECLDLPPMTDIIRNVDLEPAAAKLYRNLVKDSYTELCAGEVTATNVLTRLLRLSQLTGGFLGGDEDPKPQQVSTAKLDVLADIIETAQEGGQKLVIIARFIAEIAAIKRLLEKQGIGYAAISGETKNRAEEVKKFQEDPDTTVFIGQISTAGLGITLTAASTLVFYSLNYSMSDFEQARARVHRVGQTAPVTYIYIVARGTVDAKILTALKEKSDIAKMLIDDYRNGRNPFN